MAAFEDLADTLPRPASAADRRFLGDRLRSLCTETALRFHTLFHRRNDGAHCATGVVERCNGIWSESEWLCDPRSLLREWVHQYFTLFDATHTWPSVWIAADRLHARPEWHVDVDVLARGIGMSRSTLVRQFRDTFGLSPAEFQTVARLRTAARLLRDTQTSIEEIARQVGYERPNNLYMAFRRHTSMTPGQVRGADPGAMAHLLSVGWNLDSSVLS